MKIKIALIGCGIWGKKIFRELVKLNTEVHVYESDLSDKKKLIDLGATSVQSGLPSIHDGFQGLIVATPSSTHREIIEAVVHLGIPIFLEKPLTTNMEDALALSRVKTDMIYLMHIWLYHPGILLLKEVAESGELGKVLGIRSTRANWTSPRTDTDSVWNLAPHDITIVKAILGDIPQPKATILEKHDGIIRGMTALMGEDPYAIFEVSNRYERKIREVRLNCKNGVAILEDEKVDYIKIVYGDDKSDPDRLDIQKRFFDTTTPLQLEVQEFLDYLKGGKPPKSHFSDGLEVIKTIDTLIELAEN